MRRPLHAAAAAALALCLAGCGGEAEAPVEPPRPVRTHRVAAESQWTTRTLAGVARAGVESRLSFRVAGTVEWIGVAVGDRVRRGQVLARLDATDYELRVEEAEAALAQGEAALRRAEADFDRVRALYENNNASKSEYDAARAARESAAAQVDAAAKRLAQARQQVGYTRLLAPASGAIASVEVEVNENVSSGREVFLLTADSDLEVEVGVPEVMISQVEVGQPVSIRFDALPGRELGGTVSEAGVAVTGAASTYPVTARLDESDPAIRSGMAAEVTFRLRQQGGGARLLVPGVAVGEDDDGRFVFVVEPAEGGEATVRRRPVEVGDPAAALESIEITGGLSEGELVVTAGVRRLSDGMRVRLLDGAG